MRQKIKRKAERIVARELERRTGQKCRVEFTGSKTAMNATPICEALDRFFRSKGTP